jgi:acetyltransferase-like isoleucine patch superfamily enzyme
VGRRPLNVGAVPGMGFVSHPTAIVDYEPLRGYTARDPGAWGPAQIGDGVAIGAYAVVYRGCVIGDAVLIGDGCKIREGVSIGDRVHLHWDVQVNYSAVIGIDTVIGGGCHITGGMVIGARCFFGAGVMSANDNEPQLPYDFDRLNPPIVGNDVLIGTGAILLPGCRISDGARIGAGAIVGGDVPAGATVAAARGRRVAKPDPQQKPARFACFVCGAPFNSDGANVETGCSFVVCGRTMKS